MPLIFPTAPPTLANFVGAVSCRAISSLLSRPRQLPPLGPAQPHQCRPIAVVVAVEEAAAAVVTATGRRMKIILSRPALTYQSRSCRYCCSNVARLKSTTAATGYGITPNSSNSNSSTIIISSITSPTTSRSTTSTQTTRPRRQNGRRWQAALRTTRAHLTACVCRCRSHRSKRQTHIMSWTNKISPFISTTHE